MAQEVLTASSPTDVPVPSTSFESQKRPASSFWPNFLTIVVSASLVGFIAAGLYLYLPWPHVVVFDQALAPNVSVWLLRLVKGGYGVIFQKTQGGWQVVGTTPYLPAGVYRNVVIQLNYNMVTSVTHADMMVSLYEDTGDREFEEVLDIPVKNFWGSPVSTKFWTQEDPVPLATTLLKRIFSW